MKPCLNHFAQIRQLLTSFQHFCQLLREKNGTLSRFWMSFIDLITILLNLIRAFREGNWPLHLSSIQDMILVIYLYLPLTNLEIHTNLMNGGISCQIGSKNTFGRIPMDQTIEETINKDT